MGGVGSGKRNIQAECAKEDHDANVEEMRYSECETQEYTYHSGPAVPVSAQLL